MNLEKFKAITDGWKHVIFPDPKVEQLAQARAIICSTCDSNKHSVCMECGCPLVAKTRSTKESNECPLNKWDK